ncbi:hypothetical protein E2C01_013097 [Portunus trituberculatus]|uniref:Uncharacterized protein n=1 Tax=Portunus trituberculatus TaxID=210409 RepID=A0A5B7DG36_PORTR|nr:hypothetical protein [Portunus trituberculatus]
MWNWKWCEAAAFHPSRAKSYLCLLHHSNSTVVISVEVVVVVVGDSPLCKKAFAANAAAHR